MLADYDMWRTCRTCLRKADDLVSLDGASDININSDSKSITYKSNGDLLMECANIEVKSDDGLPPNVCVECVSALTAAFTYKQMCERSDEKLRQIFQIHLNSVRVKIERIDENNDNEVVCPLEDHWFDDTKSENFDECSQENASENGDDYTMTMLSSEDSEMKYSTFDSITVPNGTSEAKSTQKRKIKKSKMENVKCENGSLKCDICKLSFLNDKTWEKHLELQSHLDRYNQVHGSNPAQTSDCSEVKIEIDCTAQGGEDEDVKIADRAECVDGRFICEICSNSYADRLSLKLHIRVHLSSNMMHCPFCERSFSRQSYLKTHIDTQHAKAFSCENCDKVFDTKRALRRHFFDTHRPPKPEKRFICEICSRVFNRMNNLNQHRLTHSREKNFSCDICQRKVSTKQVLKDHMRIHGDKSEYYRFLCPHCGQKFTTITHMHGHIRTKHTGDKPYKCESCGLAFYRYDLLAQHKLKHAPRFICTVCGKNLSSNERLKTHSRVHTGEKPHKCGLCDQAFAQAKTLKNHLRGHSGDVPNKCNTCGDVFTHTRWLEIHRRRFGHQK